MALVVYLDQEMGPSTHMTRPGVRIQGPQTAQSTDTLGTTMQQVVWIDMTQGPPDFPVVPL